METNPLIALQQHGQSVWLDFIQRSLVEEGELQRLIDDDGVSGVTSNPTILEKAIAEHNDYDQAIKNLFPRFRESEALYEALALEDIRAVADLLRPIYDRTVARDGYVSLEVSPELARDTVATVAEAKRLWAAVDRPNAMIKVPATREGLPAMKALIAEGININATLIFSPVRYAEVAGAFVEGLESRAAVGQPLDRVASVASFFVSRIDALIDRRLDHYGQTRTGCRLAAQNLRGRAAIAAARVAYQSFKRLAASARWADLARRGAHPQRLLWASTSTKDPGFIDHVVNKKADIVRVYLPPDANCLLYVTDQCLRSRDLINVIVAGKQPEPQWLDLESAIKHCATGIGIWEWASNDDDGVPDLVLACAGDVPTLETLAAVDILRQHIPELRIRVINVVDLMTLQPREERPHGLTDEEFDALFGTDIPVIFAFHGYPWLIHRLTYRRHFHDHLHVRGYKEEGTTTTPFDMTVRNGLDRLPRNMGVIDPAPGLGAGIAYVRQSMRDKHTQVDILHNMVSTRRRSATGSG